VAALLAAVPEVRAQTLDDLARRGIDAYRVLEYDLAVDLLRQGLAMAGAVGVPVATRAEMALYLGAAELHRGYEGRADLAFRDALAAAPRVRPDTLVFPPPVIHAFEATRARTAFVALDASTDTTLAVRIETLPLRLVASAPHQVDVAICDATGDARQVLYSGPIADSLEVRWNGLDAEGRLPPLGTTALCIRSSNAAGASADVVHPVRVSPVRRGRSRNSSRPLASIAVAAFAAFLPDLVGISAPAGGIRFGLGGAVLVAGLMRPRASRAATGSNAATAVRVDPTVTHLRITIRPSTTIGDRIRGG
jgi:hypothetical protein